MAELAEQHKEIDTPQQEASRHRFGCSKASRRTSAPTAPIDMEPHELALLEIVVAAPHSGLRSTDDQTARMINAVSTPRRPHPRPSPRPQDRFASGRFGQLGARCSAVAAKTAVAIEIDGDPSRQDLDYELARRAAAAGCLFALDSDAHSTAELAPYAATALAHARLAGIPPDRIVNCWTLERLLKWARKRSG